MSLECEEGVARGDGQSLGVQEALAQEVTAGRVTSKSLRVPGRLGAKHCMDNDLRSLSLESSHRGGSWDLQPGSGLCGAHGSGASVQNQELPPGGSWGKQGARLRCKGASRSGPGVGRGSRARWGWLWPAPQAPWVHDLVWGAMEE